MNIDIPCAKPLDFFECQNSKNKKIQRALDWLRYTDFHKLEDGRYEIEPDIVATLCTKDLKTPENAKLESHEIFTDLQFLIDGEEGFGLKETAKCAEILKPYNPEKDITFYADAYDKVETLKAGQYIFLPPDCAHAPLIGNGKVRKGIIKIRL